MKNKTVSNLRLYQAISILILLTGIALMAYMIWVEDEPGALPLALVLAGAAGFIVNRAKIKKQTG